MILHLQTMPFEASPKKVAHTCTQQKSRGDAVINIPAVATMGQHSLSARKFCQM